MKKLLIILRNILFVLVGTIFVLVLLILGIRKYNDIKYKPKNYNASEHLPATDLLQYNTDIDGVEVNRISGEYINGFRLQPKNKTHRGVLVTFGGSDGGPSYEVAEPFAKAGYEVLALFFFGMENQQKELVQIPLEFFEEVLSYIDANITDNKPITVYGISRGAELALNLAVLYPEIDNIILMAPGAWNFMGLPKDYRQEMKSAWILGGKDLPFIDMAKGDPKAGINLLLDLLLNRPVDYRPGYETSSKNDPQSERARIKVENTKANILIFAGDDDKMWHSEVSAQVIQEHRPENTEVHIFDNAGHIFFLDRYFYSPNMILEMGGNLEANTKAAEESNKILTKKMEEWHK